MRSPMKKRLHRVIVLSIPIGGSIFLFMMVITAYLVAAIFFDRLTTIMNNSIALALSTSAIINMFVVRRQFKSLRYDAMDLLRDIATLDTEDPEIVREKTHDDAEPINISRIPVRRNTGSS